MSGSTDPDREGGSAETEFERLSVSNAVRSALRDLLSAFREAPRSGKADGEESAHRCLASAYAGTDAVRTRQVLEDIVRALAIAFLGLLTLTVSIDGLALKPGFSPDAAAKICGSATGVAIGASFTCAIWLSFRVALRIAILAAVLVPLVVVLAPAPADPTTAFAVTPLIGTTLVVILLAAAVNSWRQIAHANQWDAAALKSPAKLSDYFLVVLSAVVMGSIVYMLRVEPELAKEVEAKIAFGLVGAQLIMAVALSVLIGAPVLFPKFLKRLATPVLLGSAASWLFVMASRVSVLLPSEKAAPGSVTEQVGIGFLLGFVATALIISLVWAFKETTDLLRAGLGLVTVFFVISSFAVLRNLGGGPLAGSEKIATGLIAGVPLGVLISLAIAGSSRGRRWGAFGLFAVGILAVVSRS